MKSQTFGEKLRELRQKNQYTLKYVSAAIDCDEKSLEAIEQNQLRAPQNIIEPLASLYQVGDKQLMIKYLSEIVYYETRQFEFADEVLEIVQKRLKKERQGTQQIIDRKDILKSISSYFNSKSVKNVWLFGSFARDNQISFDSDIDILVEFSKPNKITLFDLIEMKADLSEKTGRSIDLIEKGQELNSIKHSIDKDKILVYAA